MSEEAGPTAAQRAWTEQLDRHGSVEFFRSRRKLLRFIVMSLVFVLVGVLMVTTASSAGDRLIGSACLALFGLMLVTFVAMWFQRTPILTVDRGGLHLPRRTPLDIGWDQVVDVGTYKVNRMASPQLKIRMATDAYARYADRMPGWQAWMFRYNQRTVWRDCATVQMLSASEQELAAWIDDQADRLAPAVHDLVLLPEDHTSPLFSTATLRPVALDKLGLSAELSSALQDFAQRSGPVADEIDEGGTPGATWGYLAGEGRELCARVQRELGPDARVQWFEDDSRGR